MFLTELEKNEISHNHLFSLNLPVLSTGWPGFQKGAFDGCHRYAEYDYLYAPEPPKNACNPEHFNMKSTIDCGGYYVVDDSVYPSTLVADFELLCDQAYKVPLVESIFFIGVLLGAPGFGDAADYFGRKKALLAGLICMGRQSIGSYIIHSEIVSC